MRRVANPFRGYAAFDEITVPAEDGSAVFVFGPNGRHERTLHGMTGAVLWQFGYDNDNRLMNISDADGNVTLIQRDGAGRPIAIVSPWGNETVLAVGDAGYLESVADPLGHSHAFEYDAGGLLTAMTDPRQNRYQFEYGPQGRLIRDSDPAGGSKQLARSQLDDERRISVQVTTAEGRQTHYNSARLPSGEKERSTVFPNGLTTLAVHGRDATALVRYTDDSEVETAQAPDPRFGMRAAYVAQLVRASPAGLLFDYSASRETELVDDDPFQPNLTDSISVNGREFSRSYTHANRTWTTTTPAGRRHQVEIDATGKPLRIALPDSRLEPLELFYDELGRLEALSRGTGQQERLYSIAYDTDGFVSALTDPAGRTTTFGRDAAGRITSRGLPDGRVIALGYDAAGNLTSVTPTGRPEHLLEFTPVDLLSLYDPPPIPSGPTPTTYDYNLDRQLTAVERPDGERIDFGYDLAGRLSSVTHSHGTRSLAYDPDFGQLAAIDTGSGVGLSYSWDGSLMTAESYSGPFAATVGFEYDDDFRLARVAAPGHPYDIGYDDDGLATAAGQMSIVHDPASGLVTGTALVGVTTSVEYNAFGELASYTAEFEGSPVYQVDYVRDGLGRITEKTETIEGVTTTYGYVYDQAGRLDQVYQDGALVSDFDYDANSNRIRHDHEGAVVEGVYDDQDRMLAYGSAEYDYDDNGDLVSKTAGGVTTYYDYDSLGALRQVSDTQGLDRRYAIDGRGRRVAVLDGEEMVEGYIYKDRLNPVAELGPGGQVRSVFVYGTRGNVPDYIDQGGDPLRIISDHLGSPRLVINTATGEIVQRIDYTAFGQITQDANPGFQPFGFAGGLWSADAGLIGFGQRDYCPLTGTWTTPDPILTFSGKSSLYGYAFNNPISYSDRDGLRPYPWPSDYGFAPRPDLFGAAARAVKFGASGLLEFMAFWDLASKPDLGDKEKHCILSCIGAELSPPGAETWGALKEMCDYYIGTSEIEDIIANRNGIRLAKAGKDCFSSCKELY